jgi:hypothetical protein
MVDSALKYRAYGLEISSELALDLPESHSESSPLLCIVSRPNGFFETLGLTGTLDSDDDGYSYFATLPDRSVYLLYEDQYQILIHGEGRQIAIGDLGGDKSNLQGFILTHALSIALAQRGVESLHATAITLRDGRAVALMAPSGSGKSTLAAHGLARGARLVTDDLLVLRRLGDGFAALAGPRRLKLYPEVARKLLLGTGVRFPETGNGGKWFLALPDSMICDEEAKVAAIVVLHSEEAQSRVSCDILGAKESFFELVAGRYPSGGQERERLEQHFRFTREVQARIPILRLTYPREFSRIDEVHEKLQNAVVSA